MLNKVVWLVAPLYLRSAHIIDVYEDFRATTPHEGDRHSSHPRVLTECISSNCNDDSKKRHAGEDLTEIPEECFNESDPSDEDGGEGPSSTLPAKEGQENCQDSYQDSYQDGYQDGYQDSYQDSFQPSVTLSNSVGVPPDPHEFKKKLFKGGENNSSKKKLKENVITPSTDEPVPNKNNFRQDFLNFYCALIGKDFNRSKVDMKAAKNKLDGGWEKKCKEKLKHDSKVRSTSTDECLAKNKEISQNSSSVGKDESSIRNKVSELEERYAKRKWGLQKFHLSMQNGGSSSSDSSVSSLSGLGGLGDLGSVNKLGHANSVSSEVSGSSGGRSESAGEGSSGGSSGSSGRSSGGSSGGSARSRGLNLEGGSPSIGSARNFERSSPNVDSRMPSVDNRRYSSTNSRTSSAIGNRKYYDKMLSHLFSLAILFYRNKPYLDKMARQLPQKYYLSYKGVQQNINRLYENNFTQMHEDFYELEKKKNPIEKKGIEKYYYAFDRTVYTLLFFLYEIQQKEDALHRTFESLPIEYKLRRDELVDSVTMSTPSDRMKDIYFTTYNIFDSINTCMDSSSRFNFNYLGKKILNNLNEEGGNVHNRASLEMKKINDYMINTQNDIVEYIKELSSYFKQFVDYATLENLFCEPVLYCYSLFLDYYLGTLDQLLDHLNIHLKYPVNKESQESLSHIYKEIKAHADNLGCTMRCFYFKKSIKPDPELSIISLFTDSKFRLGLVDKYVNKKYSNFISLMLKMMGYFRVTVASLTSIVTLQTVHALLLDTENGNIKYVDAMKALTYLTKNISHNSSVLADPREEKH
ncbi:hypothetical protein PCYB_031770 [Plasmodium cynomolgi strain B]|uniref:Erythrocyte vesicle protein 1 n=1 Tax=Plasmodium cynomolgi (strain B) TaxID=1120755 RepID=K6UPW3_PLACD|nr:hypothetical protein PCYB_031770 [Plasmodium cynomolgi strain B]GAB64764.1 hypothetical protein PCYB_031770 [Plasmodium cynomolgi strain B]